MHHWSLSWCSHSILQFSSVTQSCPTLCDPMNRSTPGLPVHHQLPEFTQTHVHRVRDTIQLSHPLSSPSPPAPNPPSIRVFSNESTLRMRRPKYWSFSFSIILSKEIPGLISFRMNWLDLLAVQGTLKSLLQHHSLKASILWRSAFFTVQLSHPYMTTGKTITLTRRTLVFLHASICKFLLFTKGHQPNIIMGSPSSSNTSSWHYFCKVPISKLSYIIIYWGTELHYLV